MNADDQPQVTYRPCERGELPREPGWLRVSALEVVSAPRTGNSCGPVIFGDKVDDIAQFVTENESRWRAKYPDSRLTFDVAVVVDREGDTRN